MRPLRYSINVTLDGSVDHTAAIADADLHRFHERNIARADGLILGRVTYQMMEEAWRPLARTGVRQEWMEDWMEPFARTIDASKKYVASSTLEGVDWNAELLGTDLRTAIERLKAQPGNHLLLAGVRFALAVAELGLIDEYEFVTHPRIAGRGPSLLAGLSRPLDLKLVDRVELGSGTVALRYVPRR